MLVFKSILAYNTPTPTPTPTPGHLEKFRAEDRPTQFPGARGQMVFYQRRETHPLQLGPNTPSSSGLGLGVCVLKGVDRCKGGSSFCGAAYWDLYSSPLRDRAKGRLRTQGSRLTISCTGGGDDALGLPAACCLPPPPPHPSPRP